MSTLAFYAEHAPHPALAGHVRCVWELRTPDAASAAVERVVPDGCCEWVFHMATPFELVAVDGTRARQSAALFVGATLQPIWLAPSSGADVLGVRFHPGGASAFVRSSARDFSERIARLEELELAWADELAERLFDAPRSARVGMLQRTLLARLVAETLESARVRHAATLLLAGRASVARVANECGVGMRQLQRSFQTHVGFGPKDLMRIGRFQRALSELGQEHASLADVAFACGYADQAHFGREFRALSGTTPARWRGERHALTDAFVAGA